METWLAEVEALPIVDDVVLDDTPGAPERGRRWFVRLLGEAKGVWSLWLTLRQRTLQAETYFTPAPERRTEEFHAHLLRRNARHLDVNFCIGAEDAIYLRSHLLLEHVDGESLDRLLGTFHQAVEEAFPAAVALGFSRGGEGPSR